MKKWAVDIGISILSGCMWFCAVYYTCWFLGYTVISIKLLALVFFCIAFRDTLEKLRKDVK